MQDAPVDSITLMASQSECLVAPVIVRKSATGLDYDSRARSRSNTSSESFVAEFE